MSNDNSSNSLEDTMPQLVPPEPLTPEPRVIGGRYVIEKEVGRGGVGEVYFAKHSFTGQPVAIKTLRSKWADNTSAIARFEREAKALSQLQHPNCVSVLDFGREEQSNDWYLAMEWVEGEDFKKVINPRPARFGALGQLLQTSFEGPKIYSRARDFTSGY